MNHTYTRGQTQLVLLPPIGHPLSRRFRHLEANNHQYDVLLAELQRFRGRVYLEDGAIRPEDLTADGRHQVAVDEYSWHVLSLDARGKVAACLRYLEESRARGFDDLWVRHAAIATSSLGPGLRRSVEHQMDEARRLRLAFGEVGGWAVAEEHRGSVEPLRIILATYGLLELLGGCTGVATATFRHSSSTILRRIGLETIVSDGVELPPYFDPGYGCQMEVLRFDSRFPNPKYRKWVEEFSTALTQAPVVCRERTRQTDNIPAPSLVPALKIA